MDIYCTDEAPGLTLSPGMSCTWVQAVLGDLLLDDVLDQRVLEPDGPRLPRRPRSVR